MAPRNRSLTGPILFGSASVALTVALLVAWIYVIIKNQQFTEQWVANAWLLVAGSISFTAIMTVLILFSVFLARQILEIRRQTTFVDSVTHELKSPLASIRLGLETIGREGLDADQRKRMREMMLGDVERLSAFIDDILEANRIEHGGPRHGVDRVALAPLVERCVTTVTRRHGVERDAVVTDVDPVLTVETDPASLEIIIKNLLDNAVKYSDPPVDVRLTGRRERNRIMIEVIDQGVGIPRALQRRVFERFYRVDEEAVRARRGTGLGLYVVRALVRRLGGRLHADSAGPNLGTTMRVDLPAGASEPVATTAAPEPRPER